MSSANFEKKLIKTLSMIMPQGYIVGGALRNAFLKRPTGDIDIVLPKSFDCREKAGLLSKLLKGNSFVLDEKTQTYRVVFYDYPGVHVDIMPFQSETIEEDLLRRDFTINALAYPVGKNPDFKVEVKSIKATGNFIFKLKGLKKKNVLDASGGKNDISNGLIKSVYADSIADDPLRMLRAFRFAGELNFKIQPALIKQIQASKQLIENVSGERIREELLKLCKRDDTALWFEKMDQTGLLTQLFPELEKQRGCAEVYYGKGGVLTHTFSVVERIEFLMKNLRTYFPKHHKKLSAHNKNIALLKMTALLHDIAKPKTAKKIGDRLRFFHHERQGAKMSAEVLGKYRFSNNEIKYVTGIISEHLRPGNLSSNKIITDKAIYRFFRDLGDYAIPLLLVCWADYTSYISKKILERIHQHIHEMPHSPSSKKFPPLKGGKTLHHLQTINYMIKIYFNYPHKISPTKLVNGHDIINTLNISPGPQVGKILEKIKLAQVEGKINNKQEALDFAKRFAN
jgi:poly(A) polymerase